MAESLAAIRPAGGVLPGVRVDDDELPDREGVRRSHADMEAANPLQQLDADEGEAADEDAFGDQDEMTVRYIKARRKLKMPGRRVRELVHKDEMEDLLKFKKLDDDHKEAAVLLYENCSVDTSSAEQLADSVVEGFLPWILDLDEEDTEEMQKDVALKDDVAQLVFPLAEYIPMTARAAGCVGGRLIGYFKRKRAKARAKQIATPAFVETTPAAAPREQPFTLYAPAPAPVPPAASPATDAP